MEIIKVNSLTLSIMADIANDYQHGRGFNDYFAVTEIVDGHAANVSENVYDAVWREFIECRSFYQMSEFIKKYYCECVPSVRIHVESERGDEYFWEEDNFTIYCHY